jgi:hypothetical protein
MPTTFKVRSRPLQVPHVFVYVVAREHGAVERERLFKIEDMLSSSFPGFSFELVVRAHQGRPLRSVAPDARVVFSREEQPEDVSRPVEAEPMSHDVRCTCCHEPFDLSATFFAEQAIPDGYGGARHSDCIATLRGRLRSLKDKLSRAEDG